jgi:hypothetical protein
MTYSFLHDNGDGASGEIGAGHYYHGVYMTASNVTVSHTEIYNISGMGVHNYDAHYAPSNNTYSENHIHNTGTYTGPSGASNAILLYNGGGHKVYNNLIINNQQAIVFATSNNTIVSNTVYGNGVNVPCTGTGGDFCTPAIWGSQPGTVVKNNIVYNNNQNTIDFSGATNNLFTNPLFADAANGNFALQPSSAAIDAGATLGAPYDRDYAGTLRGPPQGKGYDIGAYEGSAAAPACPAVSPALVASYGFEGNGTDSTSGFTATLGTGWSYVAGKYGQGATSTDGKTGITVADADALDMCGGFTYEGWISIPSVGGDYAFINKNPDSSSFLFASSVGYCGSGNLLAGYTLPSTYSYACYGTPLTTGSFQHLAVTYDSTLPSANVKLYLNGNPVTSANGTALLDATTDTLQFCTSSFNETCPSGTIIDEVRIYNYARSAAEITTDMNTPIVGGLAAPALKVSGTMKFGSSATAMKLP